MKCEQTVRQQNNSSLMVLHALPEAWREEAQQGEMARSNNSGWARNAMHIMYLTSHFCNVLPKCKETLQIIKNVKC